MLSAFNMSFTANPLSAMIAMPGLSSSLVRNPDTHVSSTSQMDPTYKGDMYEMAPLGVQAGKNFTVLWCLYWLHAR